MHARLRTAVRQRAGFRCEYCQFPEALMAEGVYFAELAD
jgi:molybdenum cofactor biosynthesis enzyme MoaA